MTKDTLKTLRCSQFSLAIFNIMHERVNVDNNIYFEHWRYQSDIAKLVRVFLLNNSSAFCCCFE